MKAHYSLCVIAGAMLALILTSGCASTTRPLLLGPEPGVEYDVSTGRQVEGRGCGYYTFRGAAGIYETALRNLKREAPFAYLTDFKAQPFWRWIVFGNLQCVRLQATAYDKVYPSEAEAPQDEEESWPR